MKTKIGLGFTLAALSQGCAFAQTPSLPTNYPSATATVAANYGKLPLSFEANQGQTDPQVRFLSRGQGYSLFLTDQAAVLALTNSGGQVKGDAFVKHWRYLRNKSDSPLEDGNYQAAANRRQVPPVTDAIRMELAGSSRTARLEGTGQLPGLSNYFIGKDPAKWRTGIPAFSRVKYSGVYPGVDLVYYGNQRQLEYDFVVSPAADPKSIRLQFSGSTRLSLDPNGDLEVTAKNGKIGFHKPDVYQTIEGRRHIVKGCFSLLAGNTVGFELGRYDQSQELTIDPVLTYSTYLGGNRFDYPAGIAVDSHGDIFISGNDTSSDYPTTPGAYQTVNDNDSAVGAGNAFVTKLNADGTALLYSTFLGSSNSNAFAIDSAGNAYVTGIADPYKFATTAGAYQPSPKCPKGQSCLNSFVLKLNATGSGLDYSTFLSGTGNTVAPQAIAVNATGNAYITGYTYAKDFPVSPGAFQTSLKGSVNAFVSQLNVDGTGLVYSTYLGGSGSPMYGGDVGNAIAVDSSGSAYVTGNTGSSDFPITPGAFQTVNGGANPYKSFVTKLNPEGTALSYSTFLGGTVNQYEFGDTAEGIALDSSGEAYVTGQAGSSDFPVTPGAFQPVNEAIAPRSIANDDYDFATGFVAKLNAGGTALIYGTYLGGTGGDAGTGIAVSSIGRAYVTGFTVSTDFPVTPGAFQEVNNSGQVNEPGPGTYTSNSFLTVLNGDASGLVYSTYFGGSDDSQGYPTIRIALDGDDNAYLEGATASHDFPVTPKAYQKVNNQRKLFIAKFDFSENPTPIATSTTLTADINSQDLGKLVTLTAHVVPVQNAGPALGKVIFTVDGVQASKTSLTHDGYALFYDSSLSAGAHAVTASYLGDGDKYSSSVSASLQETVVNQVATPSAFPLPGVYPGAQTVSLTTSTPGATIYYTTNNTTPSASSTKYTGPISVSSSQTIKAIAIKSGAASSAAASAAYTISPKVVGTFVDLYSVPNSSTLGQAVTFTAQVYADDGSNPTGTVVFRSGAEIMGTAVLSGGVANFTTSALTLLGHNITAVYTGDATHAEKGSAVYVQEVTQ